MSFLNNARNAVFRSHRQQSNRGYGMSSMYILVVGMFIIIPSFWAALHGDTEEHTERNEKIQKQLRYFMFFMIFIFTATFLVRLSKTPPSEIFSSLLRAFF